MALYQHPLFFEAKDLTDREKDKIRRHFQKRRDSGGGECGMIEKAGGNTYKICFREKEDQERVLQRKFHTISLPCGELRLTVNRTNAPQTTDQTSNSQSQTLTKVNTKGFEKIFKMDIFLMYFLRDNPKAYKVLQKQLSSIGCTVEFDCYAEEAVVKGDIEKGPGGAFGAAEKWETQVDRVFIGLTETYLCYHVFEPNRAKIFLSSVTDDMKVYPERGYVVVVGEVEAVNARIAILEKSLPIRTELPIVEKQFKPVEEEFSRGMRKHFPEVKLLIGNATIVLEGLEKEVHSGVRVLSELMKKVKEKRVKICGDLINFITSSDAVSNLNACFRKGLRNPVFLEVGSELVLSSLSSDALDEAEAALQINLCVANVPLQGAAAVPPDLDRVKEILHQVTSKANSRQVSVDVSFVLGSNGATEVRLVGYSDTVNKLRDALHDFLMNQVRTQEVLNLPHPELLDCFDKILDLIGMKQTKVTFEPTHHPHPCVLVSGPSSVVQDTQHALMEALSRLTLDTLVLDGPGAQRYFQSEGRGSKELVENSSQVLIREKQSVPSAIVKTNPTSNVRASDVGRTAVTKTSLEIRLGSLVDEQVNVLVVPMLNMQLPSTNIGKCLVNKAGFALKFNFHLMAENCTLAPGDVLQVDAPSSLGCSKLFFIECLPWDGVRGQSVQSLSKGLQRCLDLCAQQGLCSVAFPVIGPGVVLKYPLTDAVRVLTESIRQFGLSAPSGSLSAIHVVIKPDYAHSEECYNEVFRHLSLNMNQGGQAIFKSLTSDLDDITLTVGGGVKLQLVFGDITSETTDAVVKVSNYLDFHQATAWQAFLTGEVSVTQSELLPRQAILHVSRELDAVIDKRLMCRIVETCETKRFKSVAIPATCGVGGLDPDDVAGVVLRGVEAATSSTPLHCLADIRLVLSKINFFMAFKEEAMQMFSPAAITRASAHQSPRLQQRPQQQPPSSDIDLSILHTSSANQQSVFLFLGLTREGVDDAKTKLKDLHQAQCSAQTFKKEELAGLTQDDIKDLKELVETEGLYVQGGRSSQDALTVSGAKDGVSKVMQMINACLRREVRVREERDLYGRVAWCIMGQSGTWERLPKTANLDLEKKDVAEGIADAQSIRWIVDLQRMNAASGLTGQTAALKRLQHLPDFTLPLYWDNMAAGEATKVVTLQSSSAEYRSLQGAFRRTASNTVIKIERLQNVHLRRAYEAQKKSISDKNKQVGGAREQLLYHGTTRDNCKSIMTNGFNRSFSGQNATSYGQGTYFAVNAVYSAQPTYSRPAADGSQLMFVARVLTGISTRGHKDMTVPPARSAQRPHDRYDSVVNRTDNPDMYVVFHDSQAYPDYLITFKRN